MPLQLKKCYKDGVYFTLLSPFLKKYIYTINISGIFKFICHGFPLRILGNVVWQEAQNSVTDPHSDDWTATILRAALERENDS